MKSVAKRYLARSLRPNGDMFDIVSSSGDLSVDQGFGQAEDPSNMMLREAAKDIRTNARIHWQTVQDELRRGLLTQRENAAPDEHTNGARLLEEGSQFTGSDDPEPVPPRHDGASRPLSPESSSRFFERNFAVGSGAGFHGPAFSEAGSASGRHREGKLSAWWSPKTDTHAMYSLLMSSWVNLLLLLMPLGIVAKHFEWGAVAVFLLNFGGIIPLALVLGDVTEDLSLRCGQLAGGLINATFGNVVELIISMVALTKRSDSMNQVAGLSNLGSILSNLLLVLGCCFLFGGMRYQVQKFNKLANRVGNSLLFLAALALVLPLAAAHFPDIHISEDDMLVFSRITAIVLALAYAAYLYFQLVSHKKLFTGDEEETEDAALTVTASVGVLFGLSLVVALASENITGTIEDMAKHSGLSTGFLSLILLPIAGNAVEHITAVMVALRNKMDLALGIAIGSSIQIALFVIPSCVLYSWAIDNPFTLQFNGLATISVVLAVIHANFISGGGSSNWLMGLQLICTFLLIAIACLYM